MPHVWSQVAHDTAIAKTAGTFDAVDGKSATVRIEKPEAKSVLGILGNYCLTVVTDAEIQPAMILRITNKALGISEQDFVIPHGTHDGDAIQSYTPQNYFFIPLRNKANWANKLYNSEFNFKASSSVTNTGGLDIGLSVVTSDMDINSPEAKALKEAMAYHCDMLGADGGAYNEDDAKAHGTGGTAVSLSSITIPSGTAMLKGLLGQIFPNGITAGDPISGFFEFKCSGISNFSPQEWIMPIFFSPVLGTVASGSASLIPAPAIYWPTLFDLPGGSLTMQVESTLLVAAGTAPDAIQAVIYDERE